MRGRALSLLVRFAPSPRSVALGLGILAVAAGGYAIARETPIFALDRFDVRGGTPQIDAQVRQALEPFLGRSLVGLDGAAAVRRVEALPTVVRATYDRAFPHTLRLTIVPERPAAVLRSGARGWLVSLRGRVIESIAAHARPGLPRIWLPASTTVSPGETLPAATGGTQARAIGLAGAFASRVASASYSHDSLVFRLRSGPLLVLGQPDGIRLKVAVAAAVLAALPSGSSYLDVSVPGRPVSGSGVLPSNGQQGSSRG